MVESVPVTKIPYRERLERVEFDIVTFCTLSTETALNRIKAIIQIIAERISNTEDATMPTDTELSIIFNDVWSIIDRSHMINKIMQGRLRQAMSPSVDSFISIAPSVSFIRDKMDHMHEQIGNMAAKTKKQAAPPFGVITATLYNPLQLVDGALTYLDAIVLSHSTFFHHKHNFEPFPKTIFPVQSPVDHVRLHAFDQIVDISKLVLAIKTMTNVLEVRQREPVQSDRRYQIIVRATFEEPVK